MKIQSSQMKPLVSVVVPTYNRAHIIPSALDSIFAQNYRPLELIVVDDGSNDNTQVVVTKWISTHASHHDFKGRYVRQNNRGGNPARNHGISEASGELIAFLDSDDLWHSDKVKKQVDLMSSDHRVGGVYCGLQHVRRAVPPAPPAARGSVPRWCGGGHWRGRSEARRER